MLAVAIQLDFKEEITLERKQAAGKNGGLMAPKILREYRKTRRESQFCFWSRFGVTQSRGSRFEMGTEIPPPIAILLKLYFDGIITDGDLFRARRRRNRTNVVLEEASVSQA